VRARLTAGRATPINKGLARATGEYIVCWLNSDDYYLPGTLGNGRTDTGGRERPPWRWSGTFSKSYTDGRRSDLTRLRRICLMRRFEDDAAARNLETLPDAPGGNILAS
jgi:hypothetical protein